MPGSPGGGEISPPPPGLAERLVAQSGFVVYEGGNSLFNETVLVYLAKPRKERPDFDIFDHVGRPVGISRLQNRRFNVGSHGTTVMYDAGMNETLRVKPTFTPLSMTFAVSGVASGRVIGGGNRFGDLVIGPDVQTAKPGPYRVAPTKATVHGPVPNVMQHYGSIAGPKLRGLTASSLMILDQQKNQVGQIRVFSEGRWFSRVRHYVMSIEPTVKGELRRLLITVPTIITTVAWQQQTFVAGPLGES
ncbi:MAG: hypothetical protein ACRBK7_25670 [Acidimicrobiales bacterium]